LSGVRSQKTLSTVWIAVDMCVIGLGESEVMPDDV
jgi:hypothetical protein